MTPSIESSSSSSSRVFKLYSNRPLSDALVCCLWLLCWDAASVELGFDSQGSYQHKATPREEHDIKCILLMLMESRMKRLKNVPSLEKTESDYVSRLCSRYREFELRLCEKIESRIKRIMHFFSSTDRLSIL